MADAAYSSPHQNLQRLSSEKKRFKNIRIIASELQKTPLTSNVRTRHKKPKAKWRSHLLAASNEQLTAMDKLNIANTLRNNGTSHSCSISGATDNETNFRSTKFAWMLPRSTISSLNSAEQGQMLPPFKSIDVFSRQKRSYNSLVERDLGSLYRPVSESTDSAGETSPSPMVAVPDMLHLNRTPQSLDEVQFSLARSLEQPQQAATTWEDIQLDNRLTHRAPSMSPSPAKSFQSFPSPHPKFIPRYIASPILRSPSA